MNIAVAVLIAFAVGLLVTPLIALGIALLSATPFYFAGLLGGVGGVRYRRKHTELEAENSDDNSAVQDAEEFNNDTKKRVA